MLAYNSERGEVPLTVGGVDIVIAAEMERLASLSARLGCQSFDEFYRRLVGVEIGATIAAVEVLCVKGDWGGAVKAMSLKDLAACSKAFTDVLMHSAGKKPKPGKAPTPGTQKASRGGRGRNLPSSD